MRRFTFSKICFALVAFCVAMAVCSSAQTFTVLTTFNTKNGALPQGALVQGLDGNFYGVTSQGGRQLCPGGCGTLFKITTSGTLTTIHSFVPAEGTNPMAGLLLATDGNFYGLTDFPDFGPNDAFKITADGALTVLNPNVAGPAALIQDTANGNFYGIASAVGESNLEFGYVFSMTASGTLTPLHNFCGQNSCGGTADGYNPMGSLVEDVNNGAFYGTTLQGGATGNCPCGTVFVIGTGGSLKTLHRFTGLDGAFPTGALVQGSDGNLYGTTSEGGINAGGAGTAFKIGRTGILTTLYEFCSVLSSGTRAYCEDGQTPVGGMIQATDGNFYGTTSSGGALPGPSCPCGTVYQLTPGGTLTTLHTFDDLDGTFPTAALVQGTDGNLYGTTTGRIGTTRGTIFKISMGLAPFVKTLPLAAHKGTQIFILGTDLTGATRVTFNGTSSAFTVVSATEITATVPAGATSGIVQVVTPGGTLSSNVPFRVY